MNASSQGIILMAFPEELPLSFIRGLLFALPYAQRLRFEIHYFFMLYLNAYHKTSE
jgi:hypothetical protein